MPEAKKKKKSHRPHGISQKRRVSKGRVAVNPPPSPPRGLPGQVRVPPSPLYAPAYVPPSPPYAPAYVPPSPPYAPAYVPPSPPYAPAHVVDPYDYVDLTASSPSYVDLTGSSPEPRRVKRIRFYDDNNYHIVSVEEKFPDRIDAIQVHELQILKPGGSPVESLHDYVKFVRKHGGWDLTGRDHDLKTILDFYMTFPDAYDVEFSQGVTVEAFQELEKWARRLPARAPGDRFKGKVFFDWDRVLNLMEGMYIPRDAATSRSTQAAMQAHNLHPRGYVKVCLGTKARYDALKKALRTLIVDNDIQVNIVTNNGSCANDDDTSPFQYIAHFLDPLIVVHCCNMFDHKAACIDTRGIADGVSFGRSNKRTKRKDNIRMFLNHGSCV